MCCNDVTKKLVGHLACQGTGDWDEKKSILYPEPTRLGQGIQEQSEISSQPSLSPAPPTSQGRRLAYISFSSLDFPCIYLLLLGVKQVGLTREQVGFVPTSCHYFGVNCKQGLPDGNEAKKANQGNGTCNSKCQAQSIKSEYQVFGGKGEEGSGVWAGVSLKEGL